MLKYPFGSVDTYASLSPSGDHAGSMLTKPPSVSGLDSQVSRFRIIRLMLRPSSSSVKTIHFPSGDHSGEDRYLSE